MTCRSWSALLAFAGALLGLPAGAHAQQGSTDVMVEVRTVSAMGSQRLTGWSADGPTLASRRPANDWIEVIIQNGAAAKAPWRIELADDIWLPGAPGGGQGDEALWRTPDGVAVPLDLLWVRGLWRDRRPPQAPVERDYVWLATGGESTDRRSGYLLGWEALGVEFESEGGVQRYEWDRLTALQLVAEAVEPVLDGAWIVLASGGRVYGKPIAIEDRQLVVDLPWKQGWRVPLRAIASIRRREARLVELGRVEPAVMRGPEGAPARLWTPRAGKSVEGRPLRVAGREYATGFGTRVPSEIAFDGLGPGRLVVRVGVDDEVRDFLHSQPVVFRVLLDDEELARSRTRGVGEAPEDLLVEVPRAGRLRLVAEPAEALPFGGHANWLDPLYLPPGAFAEVPPSN